MNSSLESKGGGETGPSTGEGARDGGALTQGIEVAPDNGTEAEDGEIGLPEIRVELLPPGPLAAVRITPAVVRVECSGTRRARAFPLDASGRVVETPVQYTWRVEGDVGRVEILDSPDNAPLPDDTTHRLGNRVLLHAGDSPAAGRLLVTARAGVHEAHAEVPVEIVDEIASHRSPEGIPEPEFVDQPGAPWRSRMDGDRWQVNSGHRDYRTIADWPQVKLRYLAMLFAKEVVLRSHQDPRLDSRNLQPHATHAYVRNISCRKRKILGS